MDNRNQLAALSEKFIEQQLSTEEGQMLSSLLEVDPQAREKFCDNFICDYLLRDRYQRQRNMQKDIQTLVANSTDADLQDEDAFSGLPLEELLTEAVRWEKVAHAFESSISRETSSFKAYEPQVWAPAKANPAAPKRAVEVDRFALEKQWRSNFFFAFRLLSYFLAVVWLCYLGNTDPKKQHIEPVEEFRAIAKISEIIDAVWETDTEQFFRGQETTPRKMSLSSGIVQVKFGSGSEMVVEGPAELVLNGSNSVFCSRGKISAIVPPQGVGFEVRTPFGNVVDLGTEFFVNVDKNASEVSTIRGQIQWTSLDQPAETLTAGKSVRTDSLGKITWPDFVAAGYIGSVDFLTRLTNYTKREVEKKKKLEAAYDQTPSLIARFDLSEKEGTELANLSTRGRDICPFMTRVNCSVGEGRLYGMLATRFNRRDSASQLNFNTSSNSMTLAVSVQLEHLKNWGNVLFASSPDLDKQGDFLWQISREGELILWIKSADGALVDTYSSPPYFKRDNWGVWFDIAVVANADDKTIYHYVNGKEIAKLNWKNPVPLRIANGTLGNVPVQNGRAGQRFLSGAIESFRIYNDAVVPE